MTTKQMKQYTSEEFFKLIDDTWGIHDMEFLSLPEDEQRDHLDAHHGFVGTIRQWLAAGKGLAVYENQDMSHPMLGRKRFFSYGTPESQFAGEPPERLPDFPTEINWRYWLAGTYREVGDGV